MFSHARLTYTEVAAALYDQDAATRKKLKSLLPQLENLDALYRVLAKARLKRGAIDFETLETQMIFDDNGKIARIEAYARNEAHKVIEECMLAANVCASNFLKERGHAALYRVHEGPTAERLLKLRDFLGGFGLQIGGGDSPSAPAGISRGRMSSPVTTPSSRAPSVTTTRRWPPRIRRTTRAKGSSAPTLSTGRARSRAGRSSGSASVSRATW